MLLEQVDARRLLGNFELLLVSREQRASLSTGSLGRGNCQGIMETADWRAVAPWLRWPATFLTFRHR